MEQACARCINLQRLCVLALVEAFDAALTVALDDHASAAAIAHWGDWLVLVAELPLMLPATGDAASACDETKALRLRLIGRAEMAAAAH